MQIATVSMFGLALLFAWGCSGDDESDAKAGTGASSGSGATGSGGAHHGGGSGNGGSGVGGNGGSGMGGNGGSGMGGNAAGGSGGASGSGGSGNLAGCEALYVMFDQSGSMSNVEPGSTTTRMNAVRAEIFSVWHSPAAQSVQMGIGYFGQLPIGLTSCDFTDYATPDVEIAPISANRSELEQSLASREPTGETPTGAAIRGACTYTNAWRSAHSGSDVSIVLVTDGLPQAPVTAENGGCDPTLDDAKAAALECLQLGIKTYVLGVGPNLDRMDEVASAGGTQVAHLVYTGSGFGAALQEIIGAACN